MSDGRGASSVEPSGGQAWAPDIVIVGHITRDLLTGGVARLGGTAFYAALAAQRQGARVAIVTSAPPDLLADLNAAAPGVRVAATLAQHPTTFAHTYHDGLRRLALRARANTLRADDIPATWRAAPTVLLAPLAGELDPALAAVFPRASLVAATAQGWLRRTDVEDTVIPQQLDPRVFATPNLHALILSYEDVLAAPIPGALPTERMPSDEAEAEALFAAWSRRGALVVATRGPRGATLWRNGAAPERFPGYAVATLDTTGAGDVFAAAFVIRLRETGDPAAAMDFANRCAALSVEGDGPSAIPTRNDVIARFGPLL